MPKLTKTEKSLLKEIVDTNFVKPHGVRKSEFVHAGVTGANYRVLYLTDEKNGFLNISHPIKPQLFSGLKVGEDYVISELLEEEQ